METFEIELPFVPLLQAHGKESVGQAVAPLLALLPGKGPRGVFQRKRARPFLCVHRVNLAEIDPVGCHLVTPPLLYY